MESQRFIMGLAQYFMLISSIVAIVNGFKNRTKKPELGYLYLYPLISYLQLSFVVIISISDIDDILKLPIIKVSLLAFIFAEFFLLFDFFIQAVSNPTIKLRLRIFFKLYSFVWLLYAVLVDKSQQHPSTLYIIQAFTMLLLSALYFIDLLYRPQFPLLLKESSFWVAIGVIFFFSSTLPLYLFPDLIFNDDGTTAEMGLYSINFFAYGILFLFITKAYRCKKKETQ